jgi:SAM-dependent methyltransferase
MRALSTIGGTVVHEAVRTFVAEHCTGSRYGRVVEVGSRNINGTIRDLIDAQDHIGVDMFAGTDVELIADAMTLTFDGLELVLCLEVLEHDPAPRLLVARMSSWLAPGGRLIITCATDPRPAHGADMGPDEWYQNIDPDDLRDWLTPYGEIVACEVDTVAGDLRIIMEREG